MSPPPFSYRRLGLLVTAGALLAALVSGAVTVGLAEASGGPGVSEQTLTYCNEGGTPLHMNLFMPTGRKLPLPAVLQVHGGGWVSGHPMRALADSPILAGLVRSGIAVASVGYRLAPGARWPAQIRDVECAMRSLRAHAAELGIDPARIGAWGDSAGGQLVSLLGTAPHSYRYRGEPYRGETARPLAVVDEFGPVDLSAAVWGGALHRYIRATFGVEAGTPAPVLEAASPLLHVAPGDPPFLILQGTADHLVPFSQSVSFAAALRADRVPVRLVLVSGGGHGLLTPGEHPSPRWIAGAVVRFFVHQLAEGARTARPGPRARR